MRSKLLKHPSILKIKELNSGCRFSFGNVSLEDFKKVTWELDIWKASQLLDIPTKIIRQNADIFPEFFFVNINHSINNSTFPEHLKWADVKPVYKKNFRYRKYKENFRPVSILQNLWEMFVQTTLWLLWCNLFTKSVWVSKRF